MKLIKHDYKTSSDESLMTEVIKGNSIAFAEIYDRYSKIMLNYFYKMLWQDREKAEDFMQELFTKIIHKPELYNPSRKFKTWLYSVANNMCKNEYRKQEVRKGISNGLDDNINAHINELSADEKVDLGLFNNRLKKELDGLSSNHKNTFILRFKHNLSIKEIAEVLETSEGTIKSRIFYALKKLSKKLEEFKPISATLVYLITTTLNSLLK